MYLLKKSLLLSSFSLAILTFSLTSCFGDEEDEPTLVGNYDVVVDNIGFNVNLPTMTATAAGISSKVTGTVTIPSTITMNGRDFTVTSIGGFGYSKVSQVVLPNTIETIRGLAFKGCEKLNNVNIPNSVSYIGMNAFLESGIKDITIPSSVTEIETFSFMGCKNLRSMTIEDSSDPLKFELEIYRNSNDLSGYSFEELYLGRNITNIASIPKKKLVVGEYVTRLGSYSGISFDFPLEIWSYAQTPPTCYIRASNAALMNSVVYVPEDYVEIYQEDSEWGKFWNIVGI